jgi:hypothetical protein
MVGENRLLTRLPLHFILSIIGIDDTGVTHMSTGRIDRIIDITLVGDESEVFDTVIDHHYQHFPLGGRLSEERFVIHVYSSASQRAMLDERLLNGRTVLEQLAYQIGNKVGHGDMKLPHRKVEHVNKYDIPVLIAGL